MFDRFYRAEGTQASGSGLGLAIARELAERMGGVVELTSVPGRTTFTLSLPAGARAGAGAPRFHVKTAAAAPFPRGNGRGSAMGPLLRWP